MSKLIRMDRTGHTTLAEWTAEDRPRSSGRERVPRASSTTATTPS